MEADLARFYGVDLGDLWRGDLSIRRLYVLVSNLPPGSATWAAVTGAPPDWGLTEFLLADVFRALTGEEHPARPSLKSATKASPSDLIARLRAQRERTKSTPSP